MQSQTQQQTPQQNKKAVILKKQGKLKNSNVIPHNTRGDIEALGSFLNQTVEMENSTQENRSLTKERGDKYGWGYDKATDDARFNYHKKVIHALLYSLPLTFLSQPL